MNRWMECKRCGGRWLARVIPRSANSPGELYPDWCRKCFGEGAEIDE